MIKSLSKFINYLILSMLQSTQLVFGGIYE